MVRVWISLTFRREGLIMEVSRELELNSSRLAAVSQLSLYSERAFAGYCLVPSTRTKQVTAKAVFV